jgi:cytochrome b
MAGQSLKALQNLKTVRVWDLPTRLFHWALVVCVTLAVISAHIGGNAMVWHFRFGYAVFTLLLFRLIWGVVGGYWSRFVNFIRGPVTVWRYLRGVAPESAKHEVGHNPLGALSVVGLLGLLAIQVATGLVADDEISNTGPLIQYVASETSLVLTRFHKDVGQWLIVAMVALHVAAILFYWIKKKHNLVLPMLTGDKRLDDAAAVPTSADGLGARILALVVWLACAAAVAWVVGLGSLSS